MKPDSDIMCPATGFTKSCREIVTACTCPKFVEIRGTNPQTGVAVNKWGCVDSFLPMLLMENAQMSRQTGAAIESFRNEVKSTNDEKNAMLSRFVGAQGQRALKVG